MKLEDIRGIEELVNMQYDHARAELARVAEKERALRRQIDGLADQFKEHALTQHDPSDLLVRLDVQQNWAVWARQKRAALLRDLALVLAAKTECTRKLRSLHGRATAVEELLKTALSDKKARYTERKQEELLLQSFLK